MDSELWLPISGYEGRYLVSTHGRVLSLSKGGKIMAPSRHWNGHLHLILTDARGKKSHHFVHRLVACAFITNPQLKPIVNHRDGYKENNFVSNLEWVTESENQQHANTMHAERLKPFRFKRVLSDEDVENIRKESRENSHNVLAGKYGVTKQTISKIVLNKHRPVCV